MINYKLVIVSVKVNIYAVIDFWGIKRDKPVSLIKMVNLNKNFLIQTKFR